MCIESYESEVNRRERCKTIRTMKITIASEREEITKIYRRGGGR